MTRRRTPWNTNSVQILLPVAYQTKKLLQWRHQKYEKINQNKNGHARVLYGDWMFYIVSLLQCRTVDSFLVQHFTHHVTPNSKSSQEAANKSKAVSVCSCDMQMWAVNVSIISLYFCIFSPNHCYNKRDVLDVCGDHICKLIAPLFNTSFQCHTLETAPRQPSSSGWSP